MVIGKAAAKMYPKHYLDIIQSILFESKILSLYHWDIGYSLYTYIYRNYLKILESEMSYAISQLIPKQNFEK